MKKIILGMLIFFGLFHSAFALNITSHSSIQTNCDGGTFPPLVIYGADTYHLWDYINTVKEGIVSSNSEVSVYIQNNKVSIPDGWVQVSNYMPSAGQFYTVWNNQLSGLNIPALVPSDRDTPVAQIVYRVRRMLTGENNTYNFGGSYTYANFTGNTPTQINLGSLNKNFDPSTLSVDNECISIIPRWCWDGVVDAGNNETCDLGVQNGQPGSACSAICTVPTGVACIPGPTTGPQSAPITAATVGLCPVGQIVGDFASITVGNTTNYTWSCDGSVVGGACSASYATGWGGLTCTPGNFVRDAGGVVPAPISSATAGLCPVGETVGNFTDTTNGITHSYSWSCNTISAGLACTAFYTPGGGGGGGICQIGSISGVQPIPVTINTPWLCAVGRTVSNFQSTSSNGSILYSWSCDGISGCSSSYTPSTITIPGSNSYCGNGAVERPNAAGQYENCDTTAAWCVSCNIASTNPGSVSPGNLTITNPGSSPNNINTYRLIIWNGVPVFSTGDVVSFETNNPIYLQNKTATITNRSPLLDGGTVSRTIDNVWVGGTIRFKTDENKTYDGSGNLLSWTITYDQRNYPSSTILFQWSELQGFKGDTSGVVGSYEDTIVTNPTYRSQGLYASLQYLESPFHIRVSRPIIGNTAGWSAFIGSPLGYSVNTIVQTFLNNLRSGNFTTSTVNTSSAYALSSATRSVSNDDILSRSIASGSISEEWKIAKSSVNTSGVSTITSIGSEFEIDSKSTRLGDTAAIRVFKNGDVSIDGNLDISGIKTVIVENGNLLINADIRYADKASSFAWIVKNGNIIIADTVQNISGVYVTLAGAIESNGISTPNRLTVDGSLYGNTSDLVTHRSYVRGQTGYSALNVGVVVNYSNRAIMYPPPFLSRFLDQYSLQRVAR